MGRLHNKILNNTIPDVTKCRTKVRCNASTVEEADRFGDPQGR